MFAATLLQLAGVCLVPLTRRSLLAAVPAAAVTVPAAARAAASPAITPVGPSATTALASRSSASTLASPSAASEFWSGLLAGAVQKTVKELALHPLDTAKARLQVGGERRALLELFRAPYDGLTPALVSGAPAASAFFAVKDAVKRGVQQQLGKTETTLVAVACANVAYWGIKNPSEVLKVQRQAGIVDDTLGAATELWRAEGIGGFYSSYLPNYAYSTPVDSAKFLLYEQLKASLKQRRGGVSLTPLEAALGGAISASAAQALATPLDVARVRIMTSDATGVVDTVRTIAVTEGVGALYSGVTPKVARALASGAIQFSTYEATKEWASGYLARKFPGL